jgi:hypothetical protein
MSAHDLHTGDPRQVLHDGCAECKRRGKEPHVAIAHLDTAAFAAAWKRAAQWQQHGMRGISRAEMPLLFALWSVQVQFEKLGVPIGTMPGGYATTSPGATA